MSFLRMVLLLQIHTFFSDLSQVFDCLSYELLIAKLDAFDFDKNALKLVNSYHTNRNQRAKINEKYRSWSEIFRVQQGSILEFFLFNVFICDLFYFLKDFSPIMLMTLPPFNVDRNIDFAVNNLEQSLLIHSKWLSDNYIKVRTDKSHLLVSGNVRATAKIDNNYIESEKEQVLLNITIDSNLTFESHINNICKRASQKLNVLEEFCPTGI